MDWYGLSMHLLRESGTMYKRIEATQISFYDFNQDLGFQLSEMNEWVRLSKIIPWDKIEELYQERFPGKTGNVAKSARMVLGSLIIQKRKGLSDRALVKEITKNPYLQFFIGLPRFQAEKTSKIEHQDNIDRIEVERFFSTGKRCNGMGLIVTRLSVTTLSSIALSVLVTNLFEHNLSSIFWLFFCDNGFDDYKSHFVIFDDIVT